MLRYETESKHNAINHVSGEQASKYKNNKLAILEIAQYTAYPWGAEMGA